MEFQQLTYLFISVILLAIIPVTGPNKKTRLGGVVKYMVPAILFSVAIYIMWGARFYQSGIWTFNRAYITGINIWNLPIEKWIFLLVVSFVSLAVYEWAKIRFSSFEKPNFFLALSLILLFVFILTAFFFRQKLYPFFTFFLLSVYFGYTIFRNRFKKHYSKFYLTYLIIIVPVLIIKGLLISLPVIFYENSATLGIRLFNIPIEEFGYFFLLILMNISIFEYLNERRLF